MKLTKLRALELCEEMWRWLAKHPKNWKEDWPEWRRRNYYADCNCWACEYGSQTGLGCDNCLLKKLWGHCLNTKSPFVRWSDAKKEDARKRNALIIADFCKTEIKKLKRKKN